MWPTKRDERLHILMGKWWHRIMDLEQAGERMEDLTEARKAIQKAKKACHDELKKGK
jgi:hypothetical protein